MAKILIVEDELIIATVLEENLRKFGYEVAGVATSFEEAKLFLDQETIDLVLLDIKLEGEKSGIEVATLINATSKLPFIFLTSYLDKNTINKAKQTNPAGYLIKPIIADTLYTTIEIALYNHEAEVLNANDQFWLEDGTKRIPVLLKEIEYILAEENYVHVFCDHRKITIRATLKSLKEKLPSSHFIQTHRSYIVNMLRVKEVTTNEIKLGAVSVPMGVSFKSNVLKMLQMGGG